MGQTKESMILTISEYSELTLTNNACNIFWNIVKCITATHTFASLFTDQGDPGTSKRCKKSTKHCYFALVDTDEFIVLMIFNV